MAVIQRVRRVANPKRRRYSSRRVVRNAKGRFVKRGKAKAATHRRRTRAAKANPRKRRSTPVIKRYSVKTLKRELRRRGVKSNPTGTRRRKRYTRTRAKSAVRRRRSNPVLIELGAINPRRRTSMAAHKTSRRRRRNPARAAVRRRRRTVAVSTHRRRRRYTRRASNPVMHTRRRRRRHVARRHNRRRYSVRRNPSLFGMSSGKDLLAMTGGVLVGVAATKYLPTILPASITSLGGGSPFVGVLITGAAAFAAGYAAKKFGGNAFGDAVLLGGLAQAASQLLTIIAPPSLTSALALSGMGDIMAGQFVVPQNPIKAGMPMPVVMPTKTGVGAFRGAFGSRR
jgi:hypothetical protein